MIAFCCTFFQVFNIPVFWPILVMYFITLFCITMKRQIKVVTTFDAFFYQFWCERFSIWLFSIAAHDQIPLPSIHLGETKVPGKLSSIFSFTPLAFSHWPANQFDHFWPDQNYVLSFTFSFTGEWGGWRRQGAPFATECLISSWWFQPGGSW